MRKLFALFCVVFFCTIFSCALGEIPTKLSDIPYSLPSTDLSTSLMLSSDAHLILSTNWQPTYNDSIINVTFLNGDIISLLPSNSGTYRSIGKISYHLSDVDLITLSSENDEGTSTETVRIHNNGEIITSEIENDPYFFSYYAIESGEYQYRYTKELENSPLPLVAYSVTFHEDGSLVSYKIPYGQNMEVTYDAEHTMISCDALLPYDDLSGDVYRISWNAEDEAWYRNGERVDFDAYPPGYFEDIVAETPAPLPTPSPTTSSETRPTSAPEQTTAPTAPPTKAPYIVKAPPTTVKDLELDYDPYKLYHIAVQPIISEGKIQVVDNNYKAVSVYTQDANGNRSETKMISINGTWTASLDTIDKVALKLTNAEGITSEYDFDGSVNSYRSDGLLILKSDGGYKYNGEGRENVTASYDNQGNLTAYSYHNEDNSKTVSYDVYGEVITYTASSSDGRKYQYNSGIGWQRQEADGSWIATEKPDDVNSSDLPPLLVLQKTSAVEGSWYPNNTACVIGVSLRDKYPDLTKKWYHVLPVDMTIQGTQTFKMVAGNMYYIGKVFVTVDGDNVTVNRTYASGLVFPKEDMFRWFTSIGEITHDFLEQPTDSLIYGRSYSLTQDFSGKDKLLLFVCNRVTYRQPIYNDGTALVRYWPNIPSVRAHRKKAEEMLDMMQ